MKLTIKYFIPVEKEIEISAEEYCYLRANTDSRLDIFPANSFGRTIPDYDSMTENNKKELNNFWDRG